MRVLSVCLSVCLRARKHLSGPQSQTSPNFLWVWSVAVARSSSHGVTICYMYFRSCGWSHISYAGRMLA